MKRGVNIKIVNKQSNINSPQQDKYSRNRFQESKMIEDQIDFDHVFASSFISHQKSNKQKKSIIIIEDDDDDNETVFVPIKKKYLNQSKLFHSKKDRQQLKFLKMPQLISEDIIIISDNESNEQKKKFNQNQNKMDGFLAKTYDIPKSKLNLKKMQEIAPILPEYEPNIMQDVLEIILQKYEKNELLVSWVRRSNGIKAKDSIVTKEQILQYQKQNGIIKLLNFYQDRLLKKIKIQTNTVMEID